MRIGIKTTPCQNVVLVWPPPPIRDNSIFCKMVIIKIHCDLTKIYDLLKIYLNDSKAINKISWQSMVNKTN